MTVLLEPFDARLVELGVRVGRLLAADVRSFFTQVVRDRFMEATAVADSMDDEAVAALKKDTVAGADALVAFVDQRLSAPSAWLSAAAPPAESPGVPSLTTHPPVAEVVAEIERTVGEFLRTRALSADATIPYRLPMRFIDGDNLATLTLNFWKAVQRRHEQRMKADASATAASLGDRRRRWDEA